MLQIHNKDKMNGISLQLELLANIHELTIRIRWNHGSKNIVNNNNNNTNDDDEKLITNNLNNIFYEHYGILNDSNFIENYEYLNDEMRHALINSNNYTFETSNIDYKKSYSGRQNCDNDNDDNDGFAKWKYDTVIKCQFKNKSLLDSLLVEIEQLLNGAGKKIIDKWSISTNHHALKNPNNIFIGNIHPDVTLEELNQLCKQFGPILSIKLIENKQNKNESPNKNDDNSNNNERVLKNYGFVSFQLGSQASDCINQLNGKVIKGSALLVNYHVERKERERLFWKQFKTNDVTNNPDNYNSTTSLNMKNEDDESRVNKRNNSSKNKSIIMSRFNEMDYENEDNNENELEGENNFKCVFIGNLPRYIHEINNNDNDNDNVNDNDNDKAIDSCYNKEKDSHHIIVTEKHVLDFVNEILKKEYPDFEILSYYFPLENNINQSKEEEQALLKGYGFIKVRTHLLALKCIELLNSYEWHGNQLIVNRAIQNRVNHLNHSKNRHNADKVDNCRNCSSNNNKYTNKINYMENSFSRSSSFLEFMPHQYMNVPPYSQNMVMTNSTSSLSTLSSFQPQKISEDDNNEREDLTDVEKIIQSPAVISPLLQYPSFPAQPVPVSNFYPSPITITPMSLPLSSSYPPNLPSHLPIPLETQQESNLYVKHLPLTWTDDDLYAYYEKFGKIISAKIITVGGSTKQNKSDDESNNFGTSKGYGFVCFQNPLDASRAILATNGTSFDEDQVLEVSFANKKNIDFRRNNDDNTHNVDNSRYPAKNKLRYNRKFLNALMEEQNSKMFYNPQIQPCSPVGTSPIPNMMMQPQQYSFPPINYNYSANVTSPIPTFVPLSAYGPVNVPPPNQHYC